MFLTEVIASCLIANYGGKEADLHLATISFLSVSSAVPHKTSQLPCPSVDMLQVLKVFLAGRVPKHSTQGSSSLVPSAEG